jgi:hypothetical protein
MRNWSKNWTRLVLFLPAASAQWLNYPTAVMPRTSTGKPHTGALRVTELLSAPISAT